jgi:hypothetical protein
VRRKLFFFVFLGFLLVFEQSGGVVWQVMFRWAILFGLWFFSVCVGVSLLFLWGFIVCCVFGFGCLVVVSFLCCLGVLFVV